VETNGRVDAGASIHLQGDFFLFGGIGDESDKGADVCVGSLRVVAKEVVLRGEGMGVAAKSLIYRPQGPVSLASQPIPAPADRLSPGSMPSRILMPRGGTIETSSLDCNGHAMHGVVHLRHIVDLASGIGFWGRATWLDPPMPMSVSGDDAFPPIGRSQAVTHDILSWAGGGTITTRSAAFPVAKSGGVIASSLTAQITPQASALEIVASGVATQVFAEDIPQLRTTLTATVHTAPDAVPAGQLGHSSWKLKNAGPWEAIVEHVRPVNATGNWLVTVIDRRPHFAGGSPSSLADVYVTCDRSGLIELSDSGLAICSELGPGRDAEHPQVICVPQGTAPGRYTLEIVVEGNFDPVRVDLPLTVKRASPGFGHC
jgi:hypothetical protein